MTNQKKLSTGQSIILWALLLLLPTVPLAVLCWLLGINPIRLLSLFAAGIIGTDWDNVFDATLSKFAAWLPVFAAYHVAYMAAGVMREKSEFWNSRAGMFLAYPCLLFWVAVFSLFLWASYGSSVVDDDPLRGGGEVVQDFEPTVQKRNEYGVTTFFVIAIPAMVSVYRHYKKNPIKGVPQ